MFDLTNKPVFRKVEKAFFAGLISHSLVFTEKVSIGNSRQITIYQCSGNDRSGIERQFVIVGNYSEYDQDVHIPFPQNGIWTDLLNSSGEDQKIYVINGRYTVTIAAKQGCVFYK